MEDVMEHVRYAEKYPAYIQVCAKLLSPDRWAELSRRESKDTPWRGIVVIISMAARGHWTLVNGQWYRRVV